MWDMVLLLVYINIFGVVVYVLLCGQQECHRDTFVEKCNAFLLGGCFETLANVCGHVCGKKARAKLDAVSDRCCNKPNPIFQVLYLLCVLGPFGFFIATSWHHIPGPYTPEYHKYLSFVFVAATIGVYIHVCRSDPGRITPSTHARYKDNYPYDGVIYEEKFCKTCKLTRPARSTHCRICDTCVSRFDHHCVWINNCVGERNQKKFIAFLLATAGICFYGFLVTSGIIFGIVEEQGILHYVMKNRTTGEITPISYPTMFVIILFEAGSVVMVMFFSGVMGVVLLCFALYHISLVASNTTTAETFKWGDLKYDVDVAKKLLKKIEEEKETKGKNKKMKKNVKYKDLDDSGSSGGESEKEDPRFRSEVYRHQKALTYSMRKRLAHRTQGVDAILWFEHKAEQLAEQEKAQKQQPQQQPRQQEQKQKEVQQQQGAKWTKEEEEERRRYREMTEDRLNRAFLREVRWLAEEVEIDNVYNRGWKANFAEVLNPISERKMENAHQSKKRK